MSGQPRARTQRSRRTHQRRPIRLKVSFRTARSLVTEYTTSISKGGCRIRSKQKVEVGTRFVFEMFVDKAQPPVEVEGRVAWCVPSAAEGLHEIGIEYLPSEQKRAALEKVLEQLFEEHRYEKARLHPRIPVNLVVTDAARPGLKYLMRDLSRGGMGLRLPAEVELPEEVKAKAWVNLAVRFGEGAPVEIGGEVVWVSRGRHGFTHSGVGVAFLGIGVAHQEAIDALSQLRRPSELTITFGPRG